MRKENGNGSGRYEEITGIDEIFAGSNKPQSAEDIGKFLIALGGASVILFFTGLYDDRFDMPSIIKLLLQIVAGVTPGKGGGRG